MLTGERLKVDPLKSGTRQGRSFSLLLFNTVLKILAIEIRQQKEIKGSQIAKEEIKVSSFPDDMILYIENSNKSTKNLLRVN